MYKSILKQYIEKLKKEDIIKFIGKNNYQVSDKEIQFTSILKTIGRIFLITKRTFGIKSNKK